MSRVKSVRFIPVLLVAALLPVLAGCGSGSDVGGRRGRRARGRRSVYASVDTDFDGDGWAALRGVRRAVPGRRQPAAVARRRGQLREEGIDFEADVKPALGDEVALVVLDAPAGDPLAEGTSESFVLLLQPDDDAAFQRLLDEERRAARDGRGRRVDGRRREPGVARQLPRRPRRSHAWTAPRTSSRRWTISTTARSRRVFVNGAKLEPGVRGRLRLERRRSTRSSRAASCPRSAWRSTSRPTRPASTAARSSPARTPSRPSPTRPTCRSRFPATCSPTSPSTTWRPRSRRFRDVAAETNPEAEQQLGMARRAARRVARGGRVPAALGRGRALPPSRRTHPRGHARDRGRGRGRTRSTTLDKIVEFAGGFEPRLRNPTTVEIDGVEARELPLDPPVSLYYAAFDGLLRPHDLAGGHRRAAPGRATGCPTSEAFDDALDARGRTRRDAGLRLRGPREHRPARPGLPGRGAQRRSSRRRRPTSSRSRASSSTATRTTTRPASRSSWASTSGSS